MHDISTDTVSSSAVEHSIFNEDLLIETSLTFRHFLDYLKKGVQRHRLYNPFFSYVIQKFEEVPEVQGNIKDVSILQQHPALLQLLEISLFPPAEDHTEDLFAFSVPWHFKPFYSSKKFDEVLYHNIILSDKEAFKRFRKEKTQRLFKHILQRFYGMEIETNDEYIYPIIDHETGLTRFHQVHYDLRFCEVIAKKPLPHIDKDYIEKNFNLLCENFELTDDFPLNHFALEGFTVIKVKEVTESAAVTELKNILLRMLDDEETNYFPLAEKALHSLVGVPGLSISLLPFPRINDNICLWSEVSDKSFIGAILKADDSNELFEKLENYFFHNPYGFFCPVFPCDSSPDFLKQRIISAVKSYFLYPFYRGKDLLGVLEIAGFEENIMQKKHGMRLLPAQVLVIQMMSNYLHRMNDRVEQLIKEQFTSLQASVEWKFNEIAYKYLKEKVTNPTAEIGKLVFENVYPAFGAIDIRGSSLRRSEAIQQDLAEHLELIIELLNQLLSRVALPILHELHYKAEGFLQLIQKELTAENEVYVSSFIETEANESLRFIEVSNPSMQPFIQDYFSKTDPEQGDRCQHRKHYELSVNKINKILSKYLEEEQVRLQSFYPHLFEKYKTDGIEYNIFIGQSIQPAKPFHKLYRKNLYLWQLKTMADMARLTYVLEPSLPVHLQTTQLILMYGSPITISFRRDERKFDVDDAYNIRYELLKKRIDKVCIKGTDERLTQPGKIAIIYSHPKDAEIFHKYIRYLIEKGNLTPEMEQVDLEDLQGVTGLKALRVGVNFDYKP